MENKVCHAVNSQHIEIPCISFSFLFFYRNIKDCVQKANALDCGLYMRIKKVPQ